jgi:hypothetical protein
MIFGRDCDLAMTSVIATIRSPLQALISSADDQLVAFICKGRGFLGASNKDSYSGSSISSSMVTKRSRFGGDKSASYVAPDDVTAYILSSIQMCFGLVLRC